MVPVMVCGISFISAVLLRGMDIGLAGTELALVRAEAWGGINTIDCAGLHIEGIVAAVRRAS